MSGPTTLPIEFDTGTERTFEPMKLALGDRGNVSWDLVSEMSNAGEPGEQSRPWGRGLTIGRSDPISRT